MTSKPTTVGFKLPLPYSLFFLTVEPVLAFGGAILAHFYKREYLELTHAASVPDPIPAGTSIVLTQLANLYLFFAINEAFVLRSTGDLRVWKTVLFGLLVGDLGHLYSQRELGSLIYYDVMGWNAIGWGNVPLVYLGAAMRICFIMGVGLGKTPVPSKKL
jgi:hypothetical protein